jgi:hypothetical protein
MWVKVENTSYNLEVVGGKNLKELKEMFPKISEINLKILIDRMKKK